MREEKIDVNRFALWLSIDQNQTIDQETQNVIVDGYYCYYKFTKPNSLFYGERFKNEEGQPIVFQTEEAAIQYVVNFLQALT
jgi:hypothetical protein